MCSRLLVNCEKLAIVVTPVFLKSAQVAASDALTNAYTPLPTAESLKTVLQFCNTFGLPAVYNGSLLGRQKSVAFKDALLHTLIVCEAHFQQFRFSLLISEP
jgi:hypothetical protein